MVLTLTTAAAVSLGPAPVSQSDAADTDSSTVSLNVNSAVTLDNTGCATGVNEVTDFGLIEQGTDNLTDNPCNLVFSSNNDTARLRVAQLDGRDTAMRLPPPGDVDPDYGTGGEVLTNVDSSSSVIISDAALDTSDDSVVAAGINSYGYGYDFGRWDGLIARFNANGTLDTSFGTNGYVVIPDTVVFSSVEIQSDRKIVVGGTNDLGQVQIARFLPNGSPDLTFNFTGARNIDFGGFMEVVPGVAIDSLGNIVAAADAGLGDVIVIRLDTFGQMDAGFDLDGINTVDVDGGTDSVRDIGVLSDDRVVVGGTAQSGGRGHMFAMVFDSSGSLDPAFDVDGKKLIAPGAFNDMANALVVQPDDKIVLVGMSHVQLSGVDARASVARVEPDGDLDPLFDGDGTMVIPIIAGTLQTYYNDVLLSGTDIVAFGSDATFSQAQEVISSRVLTNGSLDPTFSGDGHATVTLGSTDEYFTAGVIQSDGTVVGVGATGVIRTAGFDSVGVLDPGWGTGGINVLPDTPSEGPAAAVAAAAASDGDVMVVANRRELIESEVILMRYLPDGTLDTSIGASGIIVMPWGAGAHYGSSVVVDAQKRTTVVGTIYLGSSLSVAISRYLPNGNIDVGFGTAGTTLVPGFPSTGRAAKARLLADGSLLVAATGVFGPTLDMQVIKLDENGDLDGGFGVGGVGGENAPALAERAVSVDVLTTGEVIVGGFSTLQATNENNAALTKIKADGTVDGTYGVSGIAVYDGGGTFDRFRDIAAQADDKIVAVGSTGNDTLIQRYDITGALDPAFGTAGTVVLDLAPGEEDYASAVEVLDDGRILVAGSTNYDGYILRLTDTGALDATFGNGTGIELGFAGSAFASISDLALDNDGAYVTVGYGTDTLPRVALQRRDPYDVPDYALGADDWGNGPAGMFGACLSALNGANTSSTWDDEAGCTEADSGWWNGVPKSTGDAGATIATTTASGATGTASLQFGFRTATGQPPGVYYAPLLFEAIAPSI